MWQTISDICSLIKRRERIIFLYWLYFYGTSNHVCIFNVILFANQHNAGTQYCQRKTRNQGNCKLLLKYTNLTIFRNNILYFGTP